uniref:Uncharacterized protein n=1 Tax=Arundo donax TaxID=35708 RepID=A0A0A9FIX3_ARUDO
MNLVLQPHDGEGLFSAVPAWFSFSVKMFFPSDYLRQHTCGIPNIAKFLL